MHFSFMYFDVAWLVVSLLMFYWTTKWDSASTSLLGFFNVMINHDTSPNVTMLKWNIFDDFWWFNFVIFGDLVWKPPRWNLSVHTLKLKKKNSNIIWLKPKIMMLRSLKVTKNVSSYYGNFLWYLKMIGDFEWYLVIFRDKIWCFIMISHDMSWSIMIYHLPFGRGGACRL